METNYYYYFSSRKTAVDGLVLSNSIRTAIVELVKILANELGEFNITVNNVIPGYTQTERLESLMEKNPALNEIITEIPLGRIGQPAEFASAVTFLSSERASYITSVSLAVDGGWIKGILVRFCRIREIILTEKFHRITK